MPIDKRKKDTLWNVACSNGEVFSDIRDGVFLAVLMDIRDELKAHTAELSKLNTLLHCRNFLSIPAKLDAIRRNTAKRKGSARSRAGRSGPLRAAKS